MIEVEVKNIMTHIGLICPTASGHLNPMTTLGYELKQRGHRVTLIGTLDAQPKVVAAGLEFQPIGAIASSTFRTIKFAMLPPHSTTAPATIKQFI
jgi:UDP:flavonoid glycosyltransferase YjiC (YdhE family)